MRKIIINFLYRKTIPNLSLTKYNKIKYIMLLPTKTFVSPRSSPLGTFRAEERLRLRDRNSILMMQINV